MVLERCDLRSLRRLHGVNVALKDAVEQCVESRAWREAEHLFAVPSTTDSTSSEAWRKVFQVSGGLPGPGRPSPFMVFCQERRREIIRTNPSMGFRDIGRALGAAWAGFSDEQKRSYCVGLSSAGEAQRKCSGARQLSFLNAYHTLVADAKRVARAERWAGEFGALAADSNAPLVYLEQLRMKLSHAHLRDIRRTLDEYDSEEDEDEDDEDEDEEEEDEDEDEDEDEEDDDDDDDEEEDEDEDLDEDEVEDDEVDCMGAQR